MGGRELLWYQAPPAIHAALLRGSTADEDGNISFEDEACYADSLNQVSRPPLKRCLALPCLALNCLHIGQSLGCTSL